MSRGISGNEKCVFCGWTRRNACPSVRFFCVPKEPGLKRVRWLQVFGEREVSPKDRVCSVHFRQGRPSSDPSHEDFVPHLYLNNEPPAEVIDYLESLADSKYEKPASTPNKKSGNFSSLSASSSVMKNPGRNAKPSILKRKRRPKLTSIDEDSPDTEQPEIQEQPVFAERRPVKLTAIQRQIADAVGLKPGQTVIIRRRRAITIKPDAESTIIGK